MERVIDTSPTTIVDYLIIGGGVAGAMAAQAIIARGTPGRITIVTDDREHPYRRPPLSKAYLRGDEQRQDLFVHPLDWPDDHGVTLLTRTRATRLDPQLHQVTLDDGRTVQYRKLLLATGSAPRRLEITGADLENVHPLYSLDDSDAVRAGAAKAKRVAVIGGGFVAVEIAASLVTYHVETTLIVPGKTIWDDSIPEAVTAYVQQRLIDRGIRVLTEDEAVRILPSQGTLQAGSVVTKQGHQVGGDLVVADVGIVPNRALADAALLQYDAGTQGVQVDEYLQTSDPDIYAAGDIAAFPDPVSGRRRIASWDTARAQGETAGANMAGAREPYDRVPLSSSDVFGLHVDVLGDPKPGARTLTRGNVEDGSFAVLYLDGARDVVTAALAVNRPAEELDQYRALIRQQAPLQGFEQEAEQNPEEDLTGLVPDLDAANEMRESQEPPR